MKRWLGLLLVFPALARADWVDITKRIQGPRSGDGAKVVIAPNQPLTYETSRRISLRWTFTITRPGSLFVLKDGDTLTRLYLQPGRHIRRFALEPGRWTWVGRAEGEARVFRWRVRRWRALTPVGGGFPVVLKHRSGRKYTYSIVRAGQAVHYRVKGPNRAHVFLRIPLKKSQKRGQATVDILLDGRLLQRVDLRESRSRAMVVNDGGKPVSRAREVVIRLDQGVHILEIRSVHGTVFVKVYREKRSRKRTGFRPGLMWWGQFGTTYEDNPYRFSPAAMDTYALGVAPHRYPDVASLSDVWLDVRTGIRRRFHRNRELGGTFRVRVPVRNRRLLRISFAVRGRRDLLEGGLVWVPRFPVRPTYAGPGTYVMLEEQVVRGWMGFRFHPAFRVRLEGGAYRFNAPFDGLNALFAGVSLPLRKGPLGLTLALRRVMDGDTAGGDFSHWRWSARLSSGVPLTPRLRLSGSVRLEGYTYTASPGDPRHGRTDRVVEIRIAPAFRLSPILDLVFPSGFRTRATSAPSTYQDVFKDYTTWWVGLAIRMERA